MGCSCSKPSASEPGRAHGLPTLLTAVPARGRRPQKPKGAGAVDVSCHASEGSKWHLELLAVSADLKEKLQDPQFVATRCDLDGSGDLDRHELKQAARVYGISFSGSSGENDDGGSVDLELLMDGQPRISKERFAEMVTSRQRTTSIRAVPHSLRGMALGQLQHLETLLIKTGWLAAQCEAFSTENAQTIANGTKYRQNPNLYALDTFVVTPMSKPGNCKAREQDRQRTIAEAHRKSSFSELVNPFGLLVHCFVSHYWGHDFSSTMTALDLWADANSHRMTSVKEALVFWICLFALNQHNVAEEVGENPHQGPFNAALAQATGGAVMVLDEQIHPFSRIWCLFEISRLKYLEKPFELICSEGSLSQPETRGNQAVSTEMLEATCEALWNVSAAEAQSSVEADKYQIWAEIANKTVRGAIDQDDAKRFFETLIDQRDAVFMDESIFSDFHRYIKSLLSTTMLQFLLARGQYNSAAKCCLYGACYGPMQLTEICNAFPHETERKHWLNELLMQASRPSTAQLLLDLGADARAANKEGVTALHEAACHNHRAVAEILFEHHADARASDNSGVTALIGAARHGHVAVVTLLLDHRADVSARRNDGGTALMAAATDGHVSVAKLLLERGADAGEADNEGSTALMHAATGGHEAVAKLLMEHGADARAARNDGATTLMLAAVRVYEAVARLLLTYGADAGAARNDGVTALMAAAAGGHVAVAKLLLEHGADAGAVDHEGSTALMAAAAGGHVAVLELLMMYGADAGAADHEGSTALMAAAMGGHEAVARLLLEHGADAAAARNDGVMALMLAAVRGHEAVAKLLLMYGADAGAVDYECSTALMAAAAGGHVAVAQLLLNHGADAGAEDFAGSTAMMAAAARGHEAVAELLSRELFGLNRGLISL